MQKPHRDCQRRTQQRNVFMRTFIILLFPLLILGCENLADENTDEIITPNPLTTEFLIKDKFGQEVTTFTVGEEITFEIVVQNTTIEDVTYQLTEPGHDIMINQGQAQIWSKFYGFAFPQVITDSIINASDTLILSATWTGLDNNGDPVDPGDYNIVPSLFFSVNESLVPRPTTKTIALN